MSLTIHNTTDWPAEKLLPYGAEITKAMHKLAARFPREVTVIHLAQEIIAGKKQLWLIMDGEKFVSFVLTEIQTNDATGKKTLFVPSLAGEDGIESVPLIAALEEWGRENGCDESAVFGRTGWKRSLAKEGYTMEMALFRKPLERAA
jgi:hypothetical protein